MKLSQCVSLLSLLAFGAAAQLAYAPQVGASQTVDTQRRVELREALKAKRASEHEAREREQAGNSSNRHLSAHERAELREQLRPPRPAPKPPGP